MTMAVVFALSPVRLVAKGSRHELWGTLNIISLSFE
jgi:hypothetical protein